jgi:hypothetical protein
MDLRDQAVHLIEGEDVIEHQCVSCTSFPDDERPHIVQRRVFPIDGLIERGRRGRLTALDCVALILFAVRETFDSEAERQIVASWGAELRAAAQSGEITARNPVTLLPLPELSDRWDWLCTIEEADAFVKARGMGWTCTEILEHIAKEWGHAVPRPEPEPSPPVPAETSAPDHDEELADLFDPVMPAQLEAMFPDGGRWESYAERAARKGLLAAKDGRKRFNPYRAARWWLDEIGPEGWKWERCIRVLANNLPDRSRDSKHLLTGDYD